MVFSDGKITELEKNAFDENGKLIEENSPFIGIAQLILPGAFGTTLGEYFQQVSLSKKQQLYLAAANNWVRANIRQESGAAIPEDELLKEYQNYFPMPGNTPETIQYKADLRKQTEAAMKQGSREVLDYETAQINILKRKLKGEKLQALLWLEKNRNDPKAFQVKQKLGM